MTTANPHLDAALLSFGAPVREARLAVILVHGRAQSPVWMQEQVVQRFGRPDLAWVAPAAAQGSWYPARFIEPLQANEPRLSQALERIEQLSEALHMQGLPCGRQVLMGFSQGACLVSEFAWRSRRPYRALVAFTGGLIGPPGAPRAAAGGGLDGLPVLLSTWEADPHVPVDSVRETARHFESAGARVRLEVGPGTEHGIRDAEIASARALLTDRPAQL